jgi:uncharacterized protein with GYD domain
LDQKPGWNCAKPGRRVYTWSLNQCSKWKFRLEDWSPKKHKFLAESAIMHTYILLSTLTSEGRQTLLDHPDRLELVNNEISDLGCKVIAQYAVLGPYDFVTTVEAPDNGTIAHLAISLGSRGTINIVTLPAIPTSELRDKLKEGGHLGP